MRCKLSNRQFQIFKMYAMSKNKFLTAKDLAASLDISVRTVKTDLKAIQEYSGEFTSFRLESLSSQGSRIIVTDEARFEEELRDIESATGADVSDAENRAKFMIRFLLEQRDFKSKIQLENKFYLSESTLYHCMKEVRKLLSSFNLQLHYKTNLGYKIEGEELDKRICLVKLDPDTKYQITPLSSRPDDLTEIYKVVTDSFFQAHYPMNEVMLQNITEHVHQNLARIRNNYFVSAAVSSEDLTETTAYPIARSIIRQLLKNELPSESRLENEINLLTLIILGKLEYTGNSELQEEINDFVEETFLKIDKKFSTHFGTLAVLKMKITFHLIPLFYRIKSKTQLTNAMVTEITQQFPQAANIALYFADLIHESYGLKASIDEITYLILHFNYGLSLMSQESPEKRILVITELRQSETSLLKYKIIQWFPNIIASIDFVFPSAIDTIRIENYDAIFSTEKNLEKYHGGVSHLNFFPKESDFERINLALNGFNNLAAILTKFSEHSFYYGEANSKDEVLKIITEKAAENVNAPAFLTSIKDREKIASSYFGNGIAMPHPLIPFTEKTSASVALLKTPIQWDSLHKVQLIILVSIAKDNPVEFQFWHYMSAFVQNEKTLPDLLKVPTYENFIRCLSESLAGEF
ncbi:BglG family transcription antiterminator [Lactovum odontotermitis]